MIVHRKISAILYMQLVQYVLRSFHHKVVSLMAANESQHDCRRIKQYSGRDRNAKYTQFVVSPSTYADSREIDR